MARGERESKITCRKATAEELAALDRELGPVRPRKKFYPCEYERMKTTHIVPRHKGDVDPRWARTGYGMGAWPADEGEEDFWGDSDVDL